VRVTRDAGAPSAALVAYGPEARHGTALLTAAGSPGAILAGPVAGIRALRADATMSAGHPHEPHVFVSLLAADPRHQRGGRGRALLSAAIAEAQDAGVPTYLNTANPANLPYYGSFGFTIVGEAVLPRGAPLWHLLRPIG
jgi:GNAT superfamily N-acetyltransferase